MSRDPGVVEMLGFAGEDEYPFAIGGIDPPQNVYCVSEAPAIPPTPVFAAASRLYAVTLTELTAAAGPNYYRGWYSTVANNRANIITLANNSAWPMAVSLRLMVRMNTRFKSADKVGGAEAFWRSEHQVTVLEKNASDAVNPTAGYAGAGPDVGVRQVVPTLQADFIYDNAQTSHFVTNGVTKGGRLPDLAPGRAYVAEPNIYIHEEPLPAAVAAADTGTYTLGRMWIAMWAWGLID